MADASSKGAWKGRDVLSIRDITKDDMLLVFRVAQLFRNKLETGEVIDIAKGRILANLFFEPSTRTSCSFQAAMLRLGGQVILINDVDSSSIAKGESLEDTGKTLECYADAIALRHPQVGSAHALAKAVSIPVLNAGDGAGEHPTQALLDMFTIYTRTGTLENLNIALLGDLKNGRTVHSLLPALSLFKGNRFSLVSPKQLSMDVKYIEEAKSVISSRDLEAKTEFSIVNYQTLEDVTEEGGTVLSKADVLYVTRVQKERFASLEEYNAVASSFTVNKDILERAAAKHSLTIMHPLPRLQELSTDLDDDPRSAYFFQMKCGLYVRMALLALTLGLNWEALEK